jgi:hypothetical protein
VSNLDLKKKFRVLVTDTKVFSTSSDIQGMLTRPQPKTSNSSLFRVYVICLPGNATVSPQTWFQYIELTDFHCNIQLYNFIIPFFMCVCVSVCVRVCVLFPGHNHINITDFCAS